MRKIAYKIPKIVCKMCSNSYNLWVTFTALNNATHLNFLRCEKWQFTLLYTSKNGKNLISILTSLGSHYLSTIRCYIVLTQNINTELLTKLNWTFSRTYSRITSLTARVKRNKMNYRKILSYNVMLIWATF